MKKLLKRKDIDFLQEMSGYMPCKVEIKVMELNLQGAIIWMKQLGIEDTTMADGNSALSIRKKDGITRGTMPVGLLKSNELGIFDMLGSVWEWTNTDSYAGKMNLGTCWSSDTSVGIWGYIFLDDTVFNIGFRILKTKGEQ